MNLLWIFVIVLAIFALLGVPNVGPLHHDFGWYPSGGVGVLIIILVILLLLGKI